MNILALPHNRFFWIISVALTIVLLGVYIIQVNLLTQSAYLISGLEQDAERVTEATKLLEAEYMEKIPVRDLDELAAELQFEKISSVSYIRVIEATVAQNPQE